jgi:cytochrome c oxidase subunit II
VKRPAARWWRAGAAVVLAFVATSCTADGSIVRPKGSEASKIAGTWWVIFGLAAFVYLVVGALIIFAATRGRITRRRADRLNDDAFIWIGGVLVPIAILMVVAVFTVSTTSALRKASPHELTIHVAGERWWWAVTYPEQGIVTANEIHIPAGQPIDLRLTSDNVIHSFWVPELAGKQDTIPGQPNDLRFTANDPGVYISRCAEYCGIQHAHMEARVIVQTPADFQRWVTREQRPPGEPTSEDAATGAVVFQREACAGCHTVRDTTANGIVGPNLSDIGTRRTIGAGILPNTHDNLRDWVRDAPSIKPGIIMPSFTSLSDRDVEAVVAYLQSLG